MVDQLTGVRPGERQDRHHLVVLGDQLVGGDADVREGAPEPKETECVSRRELAVGTHEELERGCIVLAQDLGDEPLADGLRALVLERRRRLDDAHQLQHL